MLRTLLIPLPLFLLKSLPSRPTLTTSKPLYRHFERMQEIDWSRTNQFLFQSPSRDRWKVTILNKRNIIDHRFPGLQKERHRAKEKRSRQDGKKEITSPQNGEHEGTDERKPVVAGPKACLVTGFVIDQFLFFSLYYRVKEWLPTRARFGMWPEREL